MTRALVYVAGPYTQGGPVVNTHVAVRCAEEIEQCGCDVVIPHLSLLWHFLSPGSYDTWMRRDQALLDRCDALVRLPGESPGSDVEQDRMISLRRPVFAWPGDIHALGEWADRWTARQAAS